MQRLRVFETHILKGRLCHTAPLKAQRAMQGRRHKAWKSQWRWWFQRNSIFQMQKDWRTHGLKTLSHHVQDWDRFKPDKTQHWERKSQLEPKSYLKLIILEKGKNLFLPIQWHCVNHPRTGPTLIMDQYNTDSMLCFCFLLLLLIFICWFL